MHLIDIRHQNTKFKERHYEALETHKPNPLVEQVRNDLLTRHSPPNDAVVDRSSALVPNSYYAMFDITLNRTSKLSCADTHFELVKHDISTPRMPQ